MCFFLFYYIILYKQCADFLHPRFVPRRQKDLFQYCNHGNPVTMVTGRTRKIWSIQSITQLFFLQLYIYIFIWTTCSNLFSRPSSGPTILFFVSPTLQSQYWFWLWQMLYFMFSLSAVLFFLKTLYTLCQITEFTLLSMFCLFINVFADSRVPCRDAFCCLAVCGLG